MVYEFDEFQLDGKAFKIRRGGQPIAVEPKAYEVLLFLIQHRDRMVEKNELLDAVWKDAIVTPNSLTRAIAQLRKALGDEVKEARYIETIPTRGYRFIADVRVVESIDEKPFVPRHEIAEKEQAPANDAPTLFKPAVESRDWEARKTPLSFAAAGLVVLILVWSGVFLWKTWRSDRDEKAWVPSRVTQLTSTQGVDLFPAFSPDGSLLAYSSLRGDRYELFIRQLAPGGREIQITSDEGQNIQPAWSPDGKMLAYHSRNRHGIWIRPSLGGLPKQLTEFGASPEWSPDGESIVFQSDAVTDLSQAGYGAMPPSTLWIIPARGGHPRQITKPGLPEGGHANPAWSPDQKRILFASHDTGKSELWSVSPQGDQLKRLWAGDGIFFDPVMSPDGKGLYYSGGAGNFHLWRLSLSPATGEAMGEPMEIANTGSALARHLSVSPDGKRIVYSLLSISSNIGKVRISPANSDAIGAPSLLTQDTNYRKIHHTFSPDGGLIAFSVWRTGADSEVWVMNAEGGEARPIATEPFALLGWFPNSTQLALISRDKPGRLFRIDATQGTQTSIELKTRLSYFGRISPDGASAAFHRRQDGVINICLTSLSEDSPKQLTFDSELMGYPAWSPDSRRIAVEMKRGDDTQIAVIPREGGASTQLTSDPGQHWPGSWSPDGSKIVYAGQQNSVWNIWWVSAQTKQRKQITHYTKPNLFVRFPAWSPKNDQIVYEYAETLGNLWMTELR